MAGRAGRTGIDTKGESVCVFVSYILSASSSYCFLGSRLVVLYFSIVLFTWRSSYPLSRPLLAIVIFNYFG